MKTMHQYLTFRIDGEVYALCVSNVREILEVPRVTRIPKMPPFMAGVINLRGSVVPLIDLKLKFALGPTIITSHTAIIVLELPTENGEAKSTKIAGIYADAVHKVISIEPSDIVLPPTIGFSIDTAFIEGLAKNETGFISILAIEGIVSAKEIDSSLSELEKKEA